MENHDIRLLVVDDDAPFKDLLVKRFSKPEFNVTGCGSGGEALKLAGRSVFDVGVIDILMPGISGIDLLREIKALQPEFEAIILTGHGSVDSAIEAMKLGAYDYVTKPCRLLELEVIIRKAYEKKRIMEQNFRLKEELARRTENRRLIGSSAAMTNLKEQIERVAGLDGPVLILGETGVGKETTAMELHRGSARKDDPFIKVNCGVLSGGQLEVELFGHESEAFRGAGKRKRGLIETVGNGTVFLDEAEQISSAMQVKLLHFLDTGGFRRIGGAVDIPANARLIMASTENLLAKMKAGGFREDFYYRISSVTINVPPLRDRKEDIPELAEFFYSTSSISAGSNKRLAKKAQKALMSYGWPGNVRELVTVLERAASLTSKNMVKIKDLPLTFEKKSKARGDRSMMSLNEIEKEHILYVLDAANGNISKASRILGISRPKLYRKMERYQSGTEV